MLILSMLALLLLPSKVELKHEFHSTADIATLRAELLYAENWMQWMPYWQAEDSIVTSEEGEDGADGYVVRRGKLHWRLLKGKGTSEIIYRRRDPSTADQVIRGRLQFEALPDSTRVIWKEWVKLPYPQRWKAMHLHQELTNHLKTVEKALKFHLKSEATSQPADIRIVEYNGNTYVVAKNIDYQRAEDSIFLKSLSMKMKAWSLSRSEEIQPPMIWFSRSQGNKIDLNEIGYSLEKEPLFAHHLVLDTLLSNDTIALYNTAGRIEIRFNKKPEPYQLLNELAENWLNQNRMEAIEPGLLFHENKGWRYVIPYQVNPETGLLP